MSTMHVVPRDDLVDHFTRGPDCVCGPEVVPVARDDGSMAWIYRHHSLDGRELHEPATEEDTDGAE